MTSDPEKFNPPLGEIALDGTTNLPALPEGHFWRVERAEHFRLGYGYDNTFDSEFRISIRKETLVRRYLGFIPLPLKRKSSEAVITRNVGWVRRFDPKYFKDSTKKSAKAKAEAAALAVKEANEGSVLLQSSGIFGVADFRVNEESIFKAATDTFKKYQGLLADKKKREEEQARADALLGDYPPKKLG